MVARRKVDRTAGSVASRCPEIRFLEIRCRGRAVSRTADSVASRCLAIKCLVIKCPVIRCRSKAVRCRSKVVSRWLT